MTFQRKFALAMTVLLVDGSLAWSLGYSLQLRSDGYRRQVEAELTDFFELPCDVGSIRGRTFSSRQFNDISVWLPDRRDRVFSTAHAVWTELGNSREERNELDLISGVLTLGSDRWVTGDYRQLLKSGLGHDFEDLHLARVGLANFEISFHRGPLAIRCRETSGSIDMTRGGDGVARLDAYELNGYRVSQGVRIHARFSPKNGIDVRELTLVLPRVPMPSIGLGPALGGEVSQGAFEGSVQLTQTPQGPEVWIRGDLDDANLAELTRGVPLGPLAGRVSVQVSGARIAESLLTHFSGRGRVADLSLDAFAPLIGQRTLSGAATLNINAIDVALGQIGRLSLSGRVDGLSPGQWLSPWGRGSATGVMSIRINNLDIVDDAIKSADIEVVSLPPPGEAGTIDRSILLAMAERALSFAWPSALPREMLPERVEYGEFGARLLVRDNQLRVLGTHGARGDVILTLKVFGQAIPVIKEQRTVFDLGPALAAIRARSDRYDAERVREWWKSRRGSGAPESGPADER